MFNNVALDAFIGLIFVFLLYSLLASILMELVAKWGRLRSKMLRASIYWMLNDERKDINGLGAAFYAYPLIKYLAKAGNRELPSYLTADNFSQTLIALLRGEIFDHSAPQMELIRNRLFTEVNVHNEGPVPFIIREETRRYLKMLWVNAAGDIDKFKLFLEKWFNDSQDRTTGWYKRKTQAITFFIGLAIAIAGNINTIAIAHLLLKDKPAREQMVNLATAGYERLGADAAKLPSATEAEMKAISARLKDDMNVVQYTLGLGWGCKIAPDPVKERGLKAAVTRAEKQFEGLLQQKARDSLMKTDTLTKALRSIDERKADLRAYYEHASPVKEYTVWYLALPGWILLAFAVSLGAPFWFDLLNKIIQIRGTGPKPAPITSAPATDAQTAVPAPGPGQRKG